MPDYVLTVKQDVGFSVTKNDGSAVSVDPQPAQSAAGVGLFADRPLPGNRGAEYFAGDSPNGQWIDSGTRWQPLIGNVLGEEVPSLSVFNILWAPFNTTAETTVSAANGGLIFQGDADPALALRGWALPCAPTGDVAIEMAIDDMTIHTGGVGQFTIWGCGIRKASTQEAFVLSLARNDGIDYSVYFQDLTTWVNNSTRGPIVTTRYGHVLDARGPTFLRVERSGPNFLGRLSRDRTNWTNFGGVAAPFASGDQLVIATDVIGTNPTPNPRFMLRHVVTATGL